MGYNPFRWYTQGKYRKKPLKSNAPLLLKIQNGDFEKSPFYKEAEDNMKLYDKMYNEYIEKSHFLPTFSHYEYPSEHTHPNVVSKDYYNQYEEEISEIIKSLKLKKSTFLAKAGDCII